MLCTTGAPATPSAITRREPSWRSSSTRRGPAQAPLDAEVAQVAGVLGDRHRLLAAQGVDHEQAAAAPARAGLDVGQLGAGGGERELGDSLAEFLDRGE